MLYLRTLTVLIKGWIREDGMDLSKKHRYLLIKIHEHWASITTMKQLQNGSKN